MDPNDSQSVFEKALKKAAESFLSLPIRPVYKTSYSLAVRYNSRQNRHEIHTNLNCEFVGNLQSQSGLPMEDCWFLALAHEAGHIELNQRCIDAQSDPADPNAQLRAIGLPLKGIKDLLLIAQCHKESAIEAYCDAKMAQAVFDFFPDQSLRLLEIIASIRQSESEKPKRFGDDYFTYPALAKALSDGAPIDPRQAASLAFMRSRQSISISKEVWLITKRSAYDSFASAKDFGAEKISSWRARRTRSPANDKEKPPPPSP